MCGHHHGCGTNASHRTTGMSNRPRMHPRPFRVPVPCCWPQETLSSLHAVYARPTGKQARHGIPSPLVLLGGCDEGWVFPGLDASLPLWFCSGVADEGWVFVSLNPASPRLSARPYTHTTPTCTFACWPHWPKHTKFGTPSAQHTSQGSNLLTRTQLGCLYYKQRLLASLPRPGDLPFGLTQYARVIWCKEYRSAVLSGVKTTVQRWKQPVVTPSPISGWLVACCQAFTPKQTISTNV
jgi:hypothetical protein